MYFPRLRELRKEQSMSQQDLGEILGVMQTVYSRYERGSITIPVELLLKLADIYGTSIDYILGRTDIR